MLLNELILESPEQQNLKLIAILAGGWHVDLRKEFNTAFNEYKANPTLDNKIDFQNTISDLKEIIKQVSNCAALDTGTLASQRLLKQYQALYYVIMDAGNQL